MHTLHTHAHCVALWLKREPENKRYVKNKTDWELLLPSLFASSVYVRMSLFANMLQAWVPWAGAEIQHIRYNLQIICIYFGTVKKKRINVLKSNLLKEMTCFGRCLYSVLGMLSVQWQHGWQNAATKLTKSAFIIIMGWGFLLYCYMLKAWHWKSKKI